MVTSKWKQQENLWWLGGEGDPDLMETHVPTSPDRDSESSSPDTFLWWWGNTVTQGLYWNDALLLCWVTDILVNTCCPGIFIINSTPFHPQKVWLKNCMFTLVITKWTSQGRWELFNNSPKCKQMTLSISKLIGSSYVLKYYKCKCSLNVLQNKKTLWKGLSLLWYNAYMMSAAQLYN